MGVGDMLLSGFPKHCTIQLTVNLISALKCAVNYDHNARPFQTDRRTERRTDEHHGNSATIRSNERIARAKN